MRDNKWLIEKLYNLWEEYFNDIPRKNLVIIKFGRKSKNQLGSIRWVTERTKVKALLKNYKNNDYEDDGRITLITITSYFKDERIPEVIVDTTIAHEMIHYAHGFFSPLKQIYNHPHKGGIIRKEMIKRGMEEEYKFAKKWLKEEWRKQIQI